MTIKEFKRFLAKQPVLLINGSAAMSAAIKEADKENAKRKNRKVLKNTKTSTKWVKRYGN